jgi:hypothetical protein
VVRPSVVLPNTGVAPQEILGKLPRREGVDAAFMAVGRCRAAVGRTAGLESSPRGPAHVVPRKGLEPMLVLMAPDVPEPPADDGLGEALAQMFAPFPLKPGPAPLPAPPPVRGRVPRAARSRFPVPSRALLCPMQPPEPAGTPKVVWHIRNRQLEAKATEGTGRRCTVFPQSQPPRSVRWKALRRRPFCVIFPTGWV